MTVKLLSGVCNFIVIHTHAHLSVSPSVCLSVCLSLTYRLLIWKQKNVEKPILVCERLTRVGLLLPLHTKRSAIGANDPWQVHGRPHTCRHKACRPHVLWLQRNYTKHVYPMLRLCVHSAGSWRQTTPIQDHCTQLRHWDWLVHEYVYMTTRRKSRHVRFRTRRRAQWESTLSVYVWERSELNAYYTPQFWSAGPRAEVWMMEWFAWWYWVQYGTADIIACVKNEWLNGVVSVHHLDNYYTAS